MDGALPERDLRRRRSARTPGPGIRPHALAQSDLQRKRRREAHSPGDTQPLPLGLPRYQCVADRPVPVPDTDPDTGQLADRLPVPHGHRDADAQRVGVADARSERNPVALAVAHGVRGIALAHRARFADTGLFHSRAEQLGITDAVALRSAEVTVARTWSLTSGVGAGRGGRRPGAGRPAPG
ncbi:hypothetical protein [Kitasatospora sp. NPDC059571]|uniref:hypothetical protein n=1 Tax=Kitasatospora sp. NPDC059571 TaxID=3346871 RepID=UPI0036810824